MRQTQRVYRLLHDALQLRSVSQLCALLDMPPASLRRCVASLRAAGYPVAYDSALQLYYLQTRTAADAVGESMRALAREVLA